jgi:hypothetical protein
VESDHTTDSKFNIEILALSENNITHNAKNSQNSDLSKENANEKDIKKDFEI